MKNIEQEEIIKERNKNLIVSASAGSGKTFTMISRIFDLIAVDKISINKMLILTYTNSAASEMRQKLLNKLNEEIGLSKDKDFLREQIDLLPISNISTFHSFYEKLIKEYYFKLNISPAFSALDVAETGIFEELAFESAIEKFKNNGEYLELFTAFNQKRKETVILENVKKLHEFLSSIEDKEFWLETVATKLLKNKTLAKTIIFDDFKSKLVFYKSKLEKYLKMSVSLKEDKLSKHINSILSDIEKFIVSNFDFAYFNASDFKIERFTFSKDLDEEIVGKIKDLRDDIKDNFLDFIEKTEGYQNFETNQKNIQEKYDLFIKFYKLYDNELFNLKTRENKYDFSDIENFALKLLKDEKILREIQSRYLLIFVDEFQDVNKVQDEFINLLSSKDNLFIVGDPKQSIYAFRQSDVSLFIDRLKNNSENSSVKNLLVNYRSDERILNFCNRVFSNIMTNDSSDIDYKKTSMFSPAKKFENDFSAVNIMLASVDEKEKEPQKTEVYSVFDSATSSFSSCKEAEMVVNKIAELLLKDIYDESINGYRKIKYSDFAIIVRSRGKLSEAIANLLLKLNIPYTYNISKNLKEFKSVLGIISALKLASGYYSEIDLAITLNRFFGLSYNDLAKIKLSNQELNFEACVDNYLAQDEILDKIKKYKETISKFAFKICQNGIFEGVNFLLNNSDFYNFIFELDDHEEEKQGVNEFLKFILNSQKNSLIEFINFVDNSDTLSNEMQTEAFDNKVQITTIHSSKGLEYPIVFLCDLCKNLKNNKQKSGILINKNVGIYLKINEDDSTEFLSSAIKIVSLKEEFKENLRLLYVGMTRAKSGLFLTGEISKFDFEHINEKEISFVPSDYMHYILGSMSDSELNYIKGSHFKNENFEYFLYDEKFEVPEKLENEIDVDIKKLKDINNIKYNTISSAYQKTSVSQISNEMKYELICASPNKFNFEEHMTALDEFSDIGTSVHKMLEILDLNASSLDILNAFDFSFKNLKSFNVESFKSEIISSAKWTLDALKNISPCGQIVKEKKFMIYASKKEIFDEGSDEKMLIQGIIDYAVIGEKVVLVDFKYSNIFSEEKLINKYKNQLKIYKFALEKFLNRNVDETYLINVKCKKLIKL